MNAHSNIQTIEQASKICGNSVKLTGQLTELTISIDHVKELDSVKVKYVGVVDVNGSYIRIQGSTHNALVGFESTINTLKNLKANIMITYSDGEKIDENFQDKCSVVYIEGRVSSPFSIMVDYISIANQFTSSILGYINGITIEEMGCNIHKVLIITNSYHNIITFRCIDDNSIIAHNKTINFAVRNNSYKDTVGEPIYLEAINILDNQIHNDIIESAIREHEMYIKTWQFK